MPKKYKKKVKIRLIPFLVFIFLCVFCYFCGKYIIDTKIKNIFIYNNKLISDQEIIDMALINDYPSYYKTFNTTIKKRLLANPIIKNVKIKRKIFNVLEIYIEEHIPLFIKDNKLVLDNKKEVDLIKCKVPILKNMNDNSIYSSFITEYIKLKDSTKSNISEIIYMPSEYDKTRFLIYMDDGNHVYINIDKLDKLDYYSEIYPTLDNKKGTLYLDSGNHFEVF
ncbi:MAG: FtsQ-type POTRA domain-containing protein [bacterium]|nr:FtsQ-type POTRA domain-containing protein [bacterium]